MSFDIVIPNSSGRPNVTYEGVEYEMLQDVPLLPVPFNSITRRSIGMLCYHKADFRVSSVYGNQGRAELFNSAQLITHGVPLESEFYLEVAVLRTAGNQYNARYIYINGSLVHTSQQPSSDNLVIFFTTAARYFYEQNPIPPAVFTPLGSWIVKSLPMVEKVPSESTIDTTIAELEAGTSFLESGAVRVGLDTSSLIESDQIQAVKLHTTARLNRRSPRSATGSIRVSVGSAQGSLVNLPVQVVGVTTSLAAQCVLEATVEQPLTKEGVAALSVGFDLSIVNE